MNMTNENSKKVISDLKGEEPKERKEPKKPKFYQLVSKVFPDGRILETVYDPIEGKTEFIIYNNGDFARQSTLEYEGKKYIPTSADSDIVKFGVVLFPSKAEEYGSTVELIASIDKFIHKYLQLSPFFEKLATYYVLFSWMFDKFNELPYLRALGDYGSGKTRFLQTIGSICYKPMFVGGASSVSPLFRIISTFRGTLVLDEADYKFSDTTHEVVKILNQGFSKGTPVLRSEMINNKFEVKAFNVFGTKLIATREYFKDAALESRCLVEKMEKKTRKDIPLNLTDEFYAEALILRNKLLMFRFRNYHKQIDYEAEIDQSIEPRLNQIIIPVLSIVDDPHFKKEFKQFIKEYNDDILLDRGLSLEAEVLIALVNAQQIDDDPTIQLVATKFNEELELKEQRHARAIGHILRKKLGLKIEHTRNGNIVMDSAFNKLQKRKLLSKYGIDEGECVNDVNDEVDTQQDVPSSSNQDDDSSDTLEELPF
jgi:hypothetical protein